MNKSLALLEFNPITDAYIIVDKILKTFSVELIRHNKICPGALLSILSGNTEDIKQIIQYSKEINIRNQCILNISHEIIKYISRISLEQEEAQEGADHEKAFHHPHFEKVINVGIIEGRHCIHAIKAADIMLKTSDLKIVKLDFSLGLYGKGFLMVSGGISEIESAIAKVMEEIPKQEISKNAVIANISPELLDRRFL